MKDEVFLSYCHLFREHGYRLYMIGGTSRDYLLGRPYADFDFATDATPKEMETFLPSASYVFARYGSVHDKHGESEVDLTTFREEGEYKDHRHPSWIKFVKEPSLDYRRRDFTINAIYLDDRDGVLDFAGGMDDLKHGIIRFIGDPKTRIQEDPLRILRAERFAKTLGFAIDPASQKAMNELRGLLRYLNPEKVKMEERKLPK